MSSVAWLLWSGCADQTATTVPDHTHELPPDDTGCAPRVWFQDLDGDLFGDPDRTSEACWPGAGWVLAGTDCDDADPAIHPGQHEIPGDGVDQDCDDLDPPDFDQDGAVPPEDCDDADPNRSPTATDVVGDAIDQNCDGVDGTDLDGDTEPSVPSGGADCDDADPAVLPSALELAANGTDDDCDGRTDALALSASDAVLRSDAAAFPSGAAVRFGEVVAAVGDLDGDGLGDLLVGAPSPSCGNCPVPGEATLQIGALAGSVAAGDATARFVGGDRTDRFGAWVGGLGDLTGDGELDFGVAAPDMDGSQAGAGAIFVWSGPQVGRPDLEAADLVIHGGSASGAGVYEVMALRADADADLDVAVRRFPSGNGSIVLFDGPFGATLDTSRPPDAQFVGRSSDDRPTVTAVADLDGDGVDEVLVGVVTSAPGAVLIFEGPHAGSRDLRADAADAAIVGVTAGEVIGNVVSAGDLDGDGRADLVLGAENHGVVRDTGGVVWVFPGPVVGTLEPAEAPIRFDAEVVGQRLGTTADPIGDVDGDGSLDLAIGESTGVVVHTGPFTPGTRLGRGDAALQVTNDVVDFLELRQGRVAGPGDVDGDGFGELLIGVPGADGTVAPTGAAYVVSLRF